MTSSRSTRPTGPANQIGSETVATSQKRSIDYHFPMREQECRATSMDDSRDPYRGAVRISLAKHDSLNRGVHSTRIYVHAAISASVGTAANRRLQTQVSPFSSATNESRELNGSTRQGMKQVDAEQNKNKHEKKRTVLAEYR